VDERAERRPPPPRHRHLLSARTVLAHVEVHPSVSVPCAVAGAALSSPAQPSHPLCLRLAVFVKTPANAGAAGSADVSRVRAHFTDTSAGLGPHNEGRTGGTVAHERGKRGGTADSAVKQRQQQRQRDSDRRTATAMRRLLVISFDCRVWETSVGLQMKASSDRRHCGGRSRSARAATQKHGPEPWEKPAWRLMPSTRGRRRRSCLGRRRQGGEQVRRRQRVGGMLRSVPVQHDVD
jgi:hypothetical protein